jgi:hypothetical protein
MCILHAPILTICFHQYVPREEITPPYSVEHSLRIVRATTISIHFDEAIAEECGAIEPMVAHESMNKPAFGQVAVFPTKVQEGNESLIPGIRMEEKRTKINKEGGAMAAFFRMALFMGDLFASIIDAAAAAAVAAVECSC